MGLNTTHNAWHGPYSSFMKWRERIAKAAGLPPLRLMEGFGGPIKWDILKDNPILELLSHSDCDGEIDFRLTKPIAEELVKLLPELQGMDDGDYLEQTIAFIDGCNLAHEKMENIEFH